MAFFLRFKCHSPGLSQAYYNRDLDTRILDRYIENPIDCGFKSQKGRALRHHAIGAETG